eukprot:jgi/Mesvir1/4719/Mv11589-RA.1
MQAVLKAAELQRKAEERRIVTLINSQEKLREEMLRQAEKEEKEKIRLALLEQQQRERALVTEEVQQKHNMRIQTAAEAERIRKEENDRLWREMLLRDEENREIMALKAKIKEQEHKERLEMKESHIQDVLNRNKMLLDERLSLLSEHQHQYEEQCRNVEMMKRQEEYNRSLTNETKDLEYRMKVTKAREDAERRRDALLAKIEFDMERSKEQQRANQLALEEKLAELEARRAAIEEAVRLQNMRDEVKRSMVESKIREKDDRIADMNRQKDMVLAEMQMMRKEIRMQQDALKSTLREMQVKSKVELIDFKNPQWNVLQEVEKKVKRLSMGTDSLPPRSSPPRRQSRKSDLGSYAEDSRPSLSSTQQLPLAHARPDSATRRRTSGPQYVRSPSTAPSHVTNNLASRPMSASITRKATTGMTDRRTSVSSKHAILEGDAADPMAMAEEGKWDRLRLAKIFAMERAMARQHALRRDEEINREFNWSWPLFHSRDAGPEYRRGGAGTAWRKKSSRGLL